MRQDLGEDVSESILCRGLNEKLNLTRKKMTIIPTGEMCFFF